MLEKIKQHSHKWVLPAASLYLNIGHSLGIFLHDIVLIVAAISLTKREIKQTVKEGVTRIYCVAIGIGILQQWITTKETIKTLGTIKMLLITPIIAMAVVRKMTKRAIEITLKWTTVLVGLVALGQQLFPVLQKAPWNGVEEALRATAFLEHPNSLAMLQAPIAAFFIYRVNEYQKGSKKRTEAILWTLIASLVVVLTQSEGGIIALGAVLGIALIKTAKQYAIVFATLIIAVMLNGTVISTITLEDNAGIIRKEIYQTTAVIIKKAPILGHGTRSFAQQYETEKPLSHNQTHNHPHNTLLALWAETGIVGVVAIVWAIVLIGKGAIKEAVQNKKIAPETAAMIVITIQGAVDTWYLHPALVASTALWWQWWRQRKNTSA